MSGVRSASSFRERGKGNSIVDLVEAVKIAELFMDVKADSNHY